MKEILLNAVNKTKNYKKFKALVSDEDFDRVNKHHWSIMKNGYAIANVEGKNITMHKYITGEKGIDHIDRNKLNNQRENLRKATPTQNAMNTEAHKSNTSGFKGVHLFKITNKYRAKIHYNGRGYYLGYFHTAIEAAKAYNAKAKELDPQFAKLNKVV